MARGPHDSAAPKAGESFDEWAVRTDPAWVLSLQRKDGTGLALNRDGYRLQAEEALHRHRDECRQALSDRVRFARLARLVNALPLLRWEQGVKAPVLRAAERARALGSVWQWLAVGVAMQKGKGSDWSIRRDAEVNGVGEAIRRLKIVLEQHPTFKLLDRNELVEDFDRAYQRLAAALVPRVRRAGRPRAVARRQTMALLLDAGVPPAYAERLLKAAGITEKSPQK